MPRPSRRGFLSALAVAAVGPLTACPAPAPNGSTSPTPSPSPSPSALPFGLVVPSRIRAVVFDGAFGTDYVGFAAETLEAAYPGVRVSISATDDVLGTVEPLLEDGATPPDLVDNSGALLLPVGKLADRFESLDDLVESTNLEGQPIAETLYHGVLEAGTFNDRLIALNYALSVYGLWHSAPGFAAEGWAVPATWDRMLDLGELARAQDRYLFVWGDEAAEYYQELAIASAIKEGGHEVRVALDNLVEDAWTHPAMLGVLDAMERCVTAGFVLRGGSYLEAQALWARDRSALFYPSGAWIAAEMQAVEAPDFGTTASPVPTLTAAPTLPATAIHASPTEQFLVPRDAANVAGGKELLRTMLSREATTLFSRTRLIPTVVRESVPSDLESTALASQTRLLADAGEHVFTWRFVTHYGLGPETNEAWAQFLGGGLSAAALAERLQAATDRVRNDPSVERYTVE